MALSHELGEAGGTDIKLEVSAAVSFDPTASPPITGSALTVSGSATGIDDAAFREKAEAARKRAAPSRRRSRAPRSR